MYAAFASAAITPVSSMPVINLFILRIIIIEAVNTKLTPASWIQIVFHTGKVTTSYGFTYYSPGAQPNLDRH